MDIFGVKNPPVLQWSAIVSNCAMLLAWISFSMEWKSLCFVMESWCACFLQWTEYILDKYAINVRVSRSVLLWRFIIISFLNVLCPVKWVWYNSGSRPVERERHALNGWFFFYGFTFYLTSRLFVLYIYILKLNVKMHVSNRHFRETVFEVLLYWCETNESGSRCMQTILQTLSKWSFGTTFIPSDSIALLSVIVSQSSP